MAPTLTWPRGTAHYVASGEQDAFDYVRHLLSYLPPNSAAEPPRYPVPPHPGAVEDNLTEEDLELIVDDVSAGRPDLRPGLEAGRTLRAP